MLLMTLRLVPVFQKLALKSSIFIAKDHYLDKKIWEGILWHFMELPSHRNVAKYWTCQPLFRSTTSFQEHSCNCMYKPRFYGELWNFQATEMLQRIELTSLFSGGQLQLPILWLEHKPQLHLPLASIMQTIPAQEVHLQPFLSYFAVSAT